VPKGLVSGFWARPGADLNQRVFLYCCSLPRPIGLDLKLLIVVNFPSPGPIRRPSLRLPPLLPGPSWMLFTTQTTLSVPGVLTGAISCGWWLLTPIAC